MAFLLRSGNGNSEIVSIPLITTLTSVWSFYVVVRVSQINRGFDYFFASQSVGTYARLIYRDGTVGDHILTMRSGASNKDFDLTGVDLSQKTKLEIVSDGTDLLLYVNDAASPIPVTGGGGAHIISSGFDRLAEGSGSITTDLDFYEAYFDASFTQERLYDANASGGTGSTLPETISSQDGTLTGFPVDDSQWVLYGAVYTQRKGSTFTATHTLGTVPDSATINGLAATFSSATTTTVSVTLDAAITTSGEYNLVIADSVAVTTQTQTVQVNVFGVLPSNNPAKKDGVALASLTNVQVRITSGTGLNGVQRFYSPTEATDASGNFSTLDLSSSVAADADPVLMHVLTAAGDSIISSETVGLI
jgi:hypothetical protein